MIYVQVGLQCCIHRLKTKFYQEPIKGKTNLRISAKSKNS